MRANISLMCPQQNIPELPYRQSGPFCIYSVLFLKFFIMSQQVIYNSQSQQVHGLLSLMNVLAIFDNETSGS